MKNKLLAVCLLGLSGIFGLGMMNKTAQSASGLKATPDTVSASTTNDSSDQIKEKAAFELYKEAFELSLADENDYIVPDEAPVPTIVPVSINLPSPTPTATPAPTATPVPTKAPLPTATPAPVVVEAAADETAEDVKIDSVTGVQLQYSAKYSVSSNPLTRSKGVVSFNGHRETYYSQRILPGYGLNIPGRHVADDGTVRDGDGYIVVASDLSYLGRYSILLTSLGPAKVYDTGCAYGTIDIYVNW